MKQHRHPYFKNSNHWKDWWYWDHPDTFEYNNKTYPWIPVHPDSYTWEDGTQSCTELEAQIEMRKFIEENS